jgi:hypothetical protein
MIVDPVVIPGLKELLAKRAEASLMKKSPSEIT